jgi:hypothetical protein
VDLFWKLRDESKREIEAFTQRRFALLLCIAKAFTTIPTAVELVDLETCIIPGPHMEHYGSVIFCLVSIIACAPWCGFSKVKRSRNSGVQVYTI